MVTYGTNPGQGVPVHRARAHSPRRWKIWPNDAVCSARWSTWGLQPGQTMEGQPIDIVFIGSCTNSRIEDLREAAEIVKGSRVADNVQALVVPGSKAIKAQAEAEGLDRIFSEAGFEWRGAGCSMCLAMNDDKAGSRQVCGQHQQPQFPGTPGTGLAQPADEPDHGRGRCSQWARGRCA